MDAALWEHQREIAAVARHRSVLVSSAQPVGKTFVSCALLCEAAGASPQQHALAIAASPFARFSMQTELARLDKDASSTNNTGNKWLEDQEFARNQLQEARGHIAVLSPLILQETLRKGVLELTQVQLLVVEDWDLVHAELPSFFKLLTGLMDEMPNANTLRIFATSRLPASKMDWDPMTNPLLKHIHVLNMLPMLPTTSMEPSFPPLHCEVFDKKTESKGEENLSVDLVHVFRLELELGNSAAVYDERKKQDKVNRFIQDAEAVEMHLGRWCLWKFVELELQANLQACVVNDADNVNNRKKRKQQGDAPETDCLMNGEGADSDSDNETEDGEVAAAEENSEMMDANTLADLGLPPSCCMLGSSNARISGALRFSSFLKVMQMFTNFKTKIMVTTSVSKSSQKMRMAPPPCDLVVVMDELLEPNKLYEFGKRADATKGFIKYITEDSPLARKKFEGLVRKMQEYIRLEQENNRAHPTSAILTVTNSVSCLSKFCDTLPGLDTYDRRPQYIVKRISIAPHMAPSLKRSKKKLLKYNAKLTDKIDVLKAEAEQRANETSEENGDESKDGVSSVDTDKLGTDDTIVIGENDKAPQTQPQLSDLSTQSSAEELSLRPIRSLTLEASSSSEEGEEWSTTMCFYGLSGAHYAILATNELYTGNTNTGWRYDFATSGVMTPEIQPITLAKRPLQLSLTKQELHDVLHFHLIVMRLTCMGVQDAVRDVDIASNNVWNEFSEQNDKGYLVVPSVLDKTKQPPTLSLDWDYVREIIESGADAADEWICVPTYRLNVSYVMQAFTDTNVGDIRKEYLADDQAWATHMKKGKSTPGNPILGRWNSRLQLEEADADQPLIHGIQVPPIVPIIRRVMQRNHDEGSIAQSKTKFNERLLIPQYTSRLRFTKSRFFDAMGLIPLLYEFERKCQISHLMGKIGLELDMSLLDDATTKPAYERLEILGDTFLKLETSWYMYEQRKDISQEAEVEQHPFQCWKPSCMGKTPDPVVAPAKWIADVLEAITGAYLVGQGEKGARYFLNWIGLYDATMTSRGGVQHPLSINFKVPQFEDLPKRLMLLQKRLKYTFRNKRLLLEAVTHPSVMSRTQKKKKTVWKGDYERLEYLGDALIEYLTLSYAFLKYDEWLPGSLTQWKSATVSNDALGKTALACFGVDECIFAGAVRIDRETMERVANIERKYARTEANTGLSPAFEAIGVSKKHRGKSKGGPTGVANHTLPKVFADVFEALVAAVFLDSGRDLQLIRD
uniref:RNase III domain-containing protein n=1 Tax=Phytophthora ramorum TaxID=164328 RepID=H3HCX7_PHYRM